MLQGYIIGNPLTDPKFDVPAKFPYVHGMGLISDEQYEVVEEIASSLVVISFELFHSSLMINISMFLTRYTEKAAVRTPVWPKICNAQAVLMR